MNLHQFLKSLSSFPRISVFRHWFLFVLEIFPLNFTITNVQRSLKSPLIKKYKKILEEKVIQLSSLVEINWKSKDFTISNEAISILWRVYFDRSGNSVSPILYRSILSLLLVFFSRIREEDFTERRAFAQESKNPRSLDPRYIRGGKRNSGLFGRGSFNVHRLDSSISSIVVATGRARGIPRNFVKVDLVCCERKSEI